MPAGLRRPVISYTGARSMRLLVAFQELLGPLRIEHNRGPSRIVEEPWLIIWIEVNNIVRRVLRTRLTEIGKLEANASILPV